jgi:hypothetical protein
MMAFFSLVFSVHHPAADMAFCSCSIGLAAAARNFDLVGEGRSAGFAENQSYVCA